MPQVKVTVIYVNGGWEEREDLKFADYQEMKARQARGWTAVQIVDDYVGEPNPPVRQMIWEGIDDTGQPFREALEYESPRRRR